MSKLFKISGLFAAVLLCNAVYAQHRPKQLDSLVSDLQKRGIDTILIYMQGAVWHWRIEPDTPAKPKCHCSFGDLIYAVNVIYKNQGKFYKLDYRCCKRTDTTRLQNSLSIPYFLLQKQALIEPQNYFSQQSEKRRFPPPIATDYPWEDVELISGKKNYSFELDSYQSTDGYKYWKSYPWIDKEIKLIKLIRQDLMLDKKQ